MNRILLTDAEVSALESIDSYGEFESPLVLDSLEQRGLIRRNFHHDNSWYELTPWGQEVLAALHEPLVGYSRNVW